MPCPHPTHQRHGHAAVRMSLRLLGLVALSGLMATGSLAQSRSGRVPNNAPSPVAVMNEALAGTAPLQATTSTAAQRQAAKVQQAYEAQLNDIRQAILEATIDRPTRVMSSAWVDEKGALHESAHFTSEAQVRGVRVMSYVQGDEAPKNKVSAEVLPWGWNTRADPDATCSAPPRPWRLPLQLQTRMEPGFTGRQLFASQSLLQSAQSIWLQQMGDSQRWRTRQKELPPENAYMRALTGPAEGSSGWAAELSLKPHAATPAMGWASRLQQLRQDEPEWRWTLTLALGQRHSPTAPIEVQWQAEQTVVISPEELGRSPGLWQSRLQSALQTQMQRWVQRMDQHSECEPIQFHVRRQNQEGLQLQAGIDSGLRVGDRVLLVNPAHVPGRMLEPEAAKHMALAQVVRVSSDRTELHQLAGPPLPSQGHWVALPL